MINSLFSLAGFDPLHAAAEVVQHDVYWRGGGGGVLQHGGGAAPQEARHQPGPRLPRALQIPDPGETAPERLQREVRAVAGLELDTGQLWPGQEAALLRLLTGSNLAGSILLVSKAELSHTSSRFNFEAVHFLYFLNWSIISPSTELLLCRFKWAESAQNRLGIRYPPAAELQL